MRRRSRVATKKRRLDNNNGDDSSSDESVEATTEVEMQLKESMNQLSFEEIKLFQRRACFDNGDTPSELEDDSVRNTEVSSDDGNDDNDDEN
jgi:hypothetical protein